MKFKLPNSLKNIFVKQDKNEDIENKPKKILDINIIDKIVSEISVIRQLKEGSLKYDKNKNKYTNAKGRKVKKQDVFKPTFVEKPNISSTTASIFQKTKEIAPTGISILALLLLFASKEFRSFISNFLKEVLLGENGLLPDPIKKFVGWFVGGNKKENPIKQSEKAIEEFAGIESETIKQQKELSQIEKNVTASAEKLKKEKQKVDNAASGIETKEKEKPADSEEEQTKKPPTPAPTPQPAATQPSPTPVQTQKPTAAATPPPTPITTTENKPITSGTPGVTWNKQPEKVAPEPVKKQPEKVAPEPIKPAPSGTPQKKQEVNQSGVQGLIIQALKESGIESQKAHANIIATVKAESNFKVKSEDMYYPKAEQIQKTFGKKRFPTLEFAEKFTKNPEALGNEAYKTTDGNSQPGDGYKYRGRGFIQHTGKNQYAAISKLAGIDLVSNPDALNEPSLAAKALVWFFLQYKRLKISDLDSMSKVNRAVGFSDPTGEKATEREISSNKIYTSLQEQTTTPGTPVAAAPSTGTQVAQQSADVGSVKKQQEADKNVSTNTIIAKNNSIVAVPSKDARGGFGKKAA